MFNFYISFSKRIKIAIDSFLSSELEKKSTSDLMNFRNFLGNISNLDADYEPKLLELNKKLKDKTVNSQFLFLFQKKFH